MTSNMKTLLTVLFGVALSIGGASTVGCSAAKDQYLCRARQGEAQANLKALHASQKTYFESKQTYASTIADLGFTPSGNRYYDLKIDSATAKGYTATATGKNDSAGDEWTIDEAGTPVVKTDKCHAK